MDFKKYYKQQDLLEFTGEGGLAAVGQGLAKAVGGAFNLMGAGVKALAGGIAKVMKDVVNKIREPLKAKWEAALKLAEEIYPYDKAIYERLKAEKSTAIREIDTYLEIASKKSLPTKYSVGLDIVYRVYASVMASALKMDGNIKKLSMKTLEDAKNKLKGVQFPQMKTNIDVDNYFKTNLEKDRSMLQNWILKASFYCMWKNKYNNNDDEGMSSIVDQIASSGTLSSETDQNIQNAMEKLESEKEEVNIQNLEDSFKLTVDQKIQAIQELINNDNTTIKLDQASKDKVDPEDLKALAKAYSSTGIAPLTLANTYVTTITLIKKYNRNESVAQIFHDITKFLMFFKEIVTDKTILNDVTPQKNAKTMMNNYVNLNGDGTLVGGKKEKITPQMASDVNVLIKYIVPISTAAPTTKPEAPTA